MIFWWRPEQCNAILPADIRSLFRSRHPKCLKFYCLALDYPSTNEAIAVVAEIADLVGMVKVGKELHTRACNEGGMIIRQLANMGLGVFLDLKYHDTPNTVYGASKASCVYGVSMFNVHIAGGEEMCRKAVEAANDAEGERPKVIGVTVLTSLDDDDLAEVGLQGPVNELVLRRAQKAAEWGLDGIVCAAKDVAGIKNDLPDDFLYVTPGIKHPNTGQYREGQKRIMTPGNAVHDCGNSILVVGGAITESDDRVQAAYEVLQDMAKHL